MESLNYKQSLIERNGIYYSRSTSAISYPESGNDLCFQLEDSSFWFKHRNNCIIELVRRFSADKLFFDVGGGNGFVAKGLQDVGIQSVLIEPGVYGCLNAKKRGLSNIVCAKLEDAKLEYNSINSLGLFDVVEHIEDDKIFLSSVCNYLKPDGFVYITVPAFNCLWSNEDVDAGHYRRYNLLQIANRVKEAGFSVVYSTYLFSILPLPIFIMRSLPSKLGLNKKSHSVDKHKKEHSVGNVLVRRAVDNLWNFELTKVKNLSIIPFGASCLIVGKKN